MIRVGDKLKVELELNCISSPADSEGKLIMRIAGSDVTNSEGRQIGSVGGSLAGSLYISLSPKDEKGMSIILHCTAKEQWKVVTDALAEQYGIDEFQYKEDKDETSLVSDNSL